MADRLGVHNILVTGRFAPDNESIAKRIIGIRCDHRDDGDVRRAFERILGEGKGIDVLVNNVRGGYESMMEDGVFTWPKPFWEQPLWRWDAMFDAGVRAHFHASQLAAPSMMGNVPYGVSKAATDKLTADMAAELRAHDVAVVSLYPGMVRTEKVMQAAKFLDLSNSESPEFIGRAVAALAADPDVMRHTGKVVIAAAVAREYGFTDIDGKSPRPLTLADV